MWTASMMQRHHPTWRGWTTLPRSVCARCIACLKCRTRPGKCRRVVATRHGYVPSKGVFKASVRVWVTNYYVADYPKLGALIKLSKLAGVLGATFDEKVYKPSEQLLNCVMCHKGVVSRKGEPLMVDQRVLRPVAAFAKEPLRSFIVQHLEGSECELGVEALLVRLRGKPSIGPHLPSPTLLRQQPTTSTPPSVGTSATKAPQPIIDLASVRGGDPVTRLLHLLSKTRWDDRDCWRDIATALKNDHGDRYKDVWWQMSRISHKFKATEAEVVWSTVARPDYKGARLTCQSLHKMAREDDPIGYVQLRAATIPPVVHEKWDKEDSGLADIAYYLLKDKLKRVGRNSLYYFDEAECLWCEAHEEKAVRPMVSHALEEVLRDMEVYFASQARATTVDEEVPAWEKRKALVTARIRYVRKQSGMAAVTTTTIYKFKDIDFLNKPDSQVHLFGVKNGVVDLRTGELRERRVEDMIMTVLPVPYDVDADTTDIERMVLDCMAGDEEMAAFLQELLGYGITGEVCEEIFPIFTGSGRNGKGGLTQTLAQVMGPFYKAVNPGLICDRKVSNVDAERGKLLGARLAVFDELKDEERLNTDAVQLLSGGDGIPARMCYGDPITIQPRHLCILATNHLPKMDQVINAIMDRIMVIEFPVFFTDLGEGEVPTALRRQRDAGLKKRLAGNLQGVLKWLVAGAVRWYASPGLKKKAPAKVHAFSTQYFEEQDTLMAFIKECCVVEQGASVPTMDFYAAFTASLRDAEGGGGGPTPKKLVGMMRNKGFAKAKARVGENGPPLNSYLGLRIADIDEVEQA